MRSGPGRSAAHGLIPFLVAAGHREADLDEIIRVENLSKTFRTPFRRKRVDAVSNVSFVVRRGEIFGFLGPNGAGKTTTIKMLTGLIQPTAGTVSMLGGGPADLSVRARIGFLPEQPYFYDYLTPVELLDVFGRIFGIPARIRKERIESLLTQVGLFEARNRTLRKFSKGMLQRTGIAQALLNDPELVILDEPLSGLDPVGRKEVNDLIATLRQQGKTIFFSSHILADIERLCDRVVILDRGVTKAAGTLSELLTSDSGEREILAGGITDVSGLNGLDGVVRCETYGTDAVRIVCESAASDRLVGTLLRAGGTILGVNDRRISLEQLFVSRTIREKSWPATDNEEEVRGVSE